MSKEELEAITVNVVSQVTMELHAILDELSEIKFWQKEQARSLEKIASALEGLERR